MVLCGGDVNLEIVPEHFKFSGKGRLKIFPVHLQKEDNFSTFLMKYNEIGKYIYPPELKNFSWITG